MKTFVERCKNAGLKITLQRRAIFKHLSAAKDHPTAEMVYERVRSDCPDISLDTVNRTLNTFARIGLASIVPTSDHARRFDETLDGHHHFRCLECGSIIDFHWKQAEKIEIPKAISDNCITMAKHLYLEGICDKCRKKL